MAFRYYCYYICKGLYLLSNLITDLLAHLLKQYVNEVKLMGLIPF